MSNAYDELPYPGKPFSQTHPDRLATLATLFGMTPAPVDRCRILEVGCGDGANLIPMAFGLPSSQCIGIDLSRTAIALGQAIVDTLELPNITLRQLDLMAAGPDLGEFDYIIAHGIYSWVPPDVRERLLEICKSRLRPNGIAFISYNAYPGGHLRDILREMMLFHTRNASSPAEKLRQARELLEFLVVAHREDDAYSLFLRTEVKSLLERHPAAFYHDELEVHNHRFYFHEFTRDATRHGLQYLSEATPLSMQTGVLGNDLTTKLRAITGSDEMLQQQYMDFVKLRNFRQTLLCHADIPLDRTPHTSSILKMWAAADASAVSPDPDVRSENSQEFKYRSGGSMSTNHPLAKAAMLHLGRAWPRAVPFDELLQVARSLAGRDITSGPSLEEDSTWLAEMLLRLYAANFLELHVYEPPFVTSVSRRPVASALARAQIQKGSASTTLKHEAAELADQGARDLLLLLDGTHDRAQLLYEMRQRYDPSEITPERLEANLERLAKMPLLVA